MHKFTKENYNGFRQAEKKTLTSNIQKKVGRTTPSLLSADGNALINSDRKESLELPRLRAKLARRVTKMFEPSAKEKVNSPSLDTKLALSSITT